MPSSTPQGSDQHHRVLSGLVSALKQTMSCLLPPCVYGGLLTVSGWRVSNYHISQGVSEENEIMNVHLVAYCLSFLWKSISPVLQ